MIYGDTGRFLLLTNFNLKEWLWDTGQNCHENNLCKITYVYVPTF